VRVEAVAERHESEGAMTDVVMPLAPTISDPKALQTHVGGAENAPGEKVSRYAPGLG
jgi:hypothetical protein